jgi:hypothetical protein
MSNHQDEPETIPSLKDTGEDLSGEEQARKTQSPPPGYPSDTTSPQRGLTGQEGNVNAEMTPKIADDAAHGQTQTPAPSDDVGVPADHEIAREEDTATE